ncbi:MAG: hypothetical protein ACI9K2_002223, partial [Myxococcota bacterium]
PPREDMNLISPFNSRVSPFGKCIPGPEEH